MNLLVLADLALQFGRIHRVTFHPDGLRPETDTDHTVMLGWMAISVAKAHPQLLLDVGLVAQFALIHDMVEAECGDTNSFGITPEGKAAKDAREAEAMVRLVTRLTPSHFHLAVLLTAYEEQEKPEARFVRYLDKVLPKLTHALNGGAAFLEMGVSVEEVRKVDDIQIDALNTQYPEFASTLGPLLTEACAASEVAYRARQTL